MTQDEICCRLMECSAEADRIEVKRANTFLFFQQAIELNDGPAMANGRQMLHTIMDEHYDNMSSAITLRQMLDKSAA